VLAIALVERFRERRRLERREDPLVAHDLRHLDSKLGQRRRHLEPDETAADHDRPPCLSSPSAQLERVVESAQRQRTFECPRPGAGGDHDRVGVELVERADVLPQAKVDAMFRIPLRGMDERVVRLRLAAEQSLRERWPVIRPVRVLRPDRDCIGATRVAVALDHLRGGETAADDPDHRASRPIAAR
jgi:hypothetical protein